MTDLAQIAFAFALVLARTSALVGFAPGISTAALLARAKVVLSCALALLIAPSVIHRVPQLSDLLTASLMMMHECAAGAAIGLSVELCFEAVRVAGYVCGLQFGLSLASIIDPVSQVESTVVGSFLETIAVALFFALEGHHKLLKILFASYANLPAGSTGFHEPGVSSLLAFAGSALSTGIALAAPVIGLTLLIDVVVAQVARVAPQLPVVPVGISLKAVSGMAILAGTLLFWPGSIGNWFGDGLRLAQEIVR